jgi:hypothetical protein
LRPWNEDGLRIRMREEPSKTVCGGDIRTMTRGSDEDEKSDATFRLSIGKL